MCVVVLFVVVQSEVDVLQIKLRERCKGFPPHKVVIHGGLKMLIICHVAPLLDLVLLPTWSLISMLNLLNFSTILVVPNSIYSSVTKKMISTCSYISVRLVRMVLLWELGYTRTLHSLHRPPTTSQRPRQPRGKLLHENIDIWCEKDRGMLEQLIEARCRVI